MKIVVECWFRNEYCFCKCSLGFWKPELIKHIGEIYYFTSYYRFRFNLVEQNRKVTCFLLAWLVEASENGHQEEKIEETKEDVTEQSDVIKNTELEGDQVKDSESLDAVNKDIVTDEPLDAVNRDFETDDLPANALEQQSAENLEESAKEEDQEFGEEQQDPTSDVASLGDVSFLKEQLIAPDQPTSRKMEVPSNKVN